jgi:hypothetical protein
LYFADSIKKTWRQLLKGFQSCRKTGKLSFVVRIGQ